MIEDEVRGRGARSNMESVQIDPGQGSLIEAIESAVCSRLGPVPMQTDFRRSAGGGADAGVLIKASVGNAAGKELAADFNNCRAIESSRFIKQKLSLRFTDDFLASRIECQERAGNALGRPHSGRRVVVGFCDPNANKALHVGHLRNIAIGSALAALWRGLGARVECQSVVCDIGRNVAEAIAGLLAAGGERVLARGGPLSPQLGDLYAAYVKGSGVATAGGAEADAPIARELSRHDDEADSVLDRWRDGDSRLHALWRATIARVLDEQSSTLERIGVRFDRIICESDSIAGADGMIELLVAQGFAFRDVDGTILLETGRPDYARCPLTRTDGFPTEHLRALVLWDALRDTLADADPVVHVMGHEWRTSTEIRLDVLERLRETGFSARYQMLPHQLVRVDGSDMKSSTGKVLLLDHLCDAVDEALAAQAYYGDMEESVAMRRAAVLTPMLETDLENTIDVSLEALLSASSNPGLRIARAIAATRAAAPVKSITPRVRFLALQGERLHRMIETAAVKTEPKLVVRHLLRLADERLAENATGEGDRLLRMVLQTGAGALGWRE